MKETIAEDMNITKKTAQYTQFQLFIFHFHHHNLIWDQYTPPLPFIKA